MSSDRSKYSAGLGRKTRPTSANTGATPSGREGSYQSTNPTIGTPIFHSSGLVPIRYSSPGRYLPLALATTIASSSTSPSSDQFNSVFYRSATNVLTPLEVCQSTFDTSSSATRAGGVPVARDSVNGRSNLGTSSTATSSTAQRNVVNADRGAQEESRTLFHKWKLDVEDEVPAHESFAIQSGEGSSSTKVWPDSSVVNDDDETGGGGGEEEKKDNDTDWVTMVNKSR